MIAIQEDTLARILATLDDLDTRTSRLLIIEIQGSVKQVEEGPRPVDIPKRTDIPNSKDRFTVPAMDS